jgi:hypothetical protein
MTTHRLLPPAALPGSPAAGGAFSTTVNGRAYAATPGAAIDAPDFDSIALVAAGWIFVAPSGPTSGRPSPSTNTTSPYPVSPGLDTKYYDTTLGFLLFWDGAAWRDPTGTSR